MGTTRRKKQPKGSRPQGVVLADADGGVLAKQDSKQREPRNHSPLTKSSRVSKGRPAKTSSNAGRRVKNGKEGAPSSKAPPSLGITRLMTLRCGVTINRVCVAPHRATVSCRTTTPRVLRKWPTRGLLLYQRPHKAIRVDWRCFCGLFWAPGGPLVAKKTVCTSLGPGRMPGRSLERPQGPQDHFCVLESPKEQLF
jgi:hypothetical protein